MDAASKNDRLVSWIQHTLQHHHSPQYRSFNESSRNFICWNFDFVSRMRDFQTLEPEVLVQLLRRSDLVIKDEFALFQSVSKWLLLQSDKQQEPHVPADTSSTGENNGMPNDSCIRDEGVSTPHTTLSLLVTQIMAHIRFHLMSYEDMANVLLDPISTHYGHCFTDRVLEAMKFQAIGFEARKGAFDRMRESFDSDFTAFTPRLYTDDMWSSAILIENYSEIPSYTTRTFVFETKSTLFERQSKRDHNGCSKRMRTWESASMQEWAVELFAKGVSFEKASLIRSPSLIVPDWKSNTVRISISCIRSCCPDTAFNVGILISGRKDDQDFVRHVYTRRWFFDGDERVMRIDDVVPFDQLNTPSPRLVPAQFQAYSPFLTGEDRNTLKVQIVITPIAH